FSLTEITSTKQIKVVEVIKNLTCRISRRLTSSVRSLDAVQRNPGGIALQPSRIPLHSIQATLQSVWCGPYTSASRRSIIPSA
ncbi:MAG: hypothetical protein ABW104_19925, partial [Candidatus Thiodiazotropha sp. 6PLUC2]